MLPLRYAHRRLLLLMAGGAFAFGCATPGAKDFELGQTLKSQGDLNAAHQAFVRAASANPSSAEYRSAKQATGSILAVEVAETAAAQEQDGDWSGASQSWARAAELNPEDKDYAVRAALAGAKTDDLGVDEWFETVNGVAEQYPDSEDAQAALTKARREAYEYHLALGREAVAKRKGSEALVHFNRAKELDPKTPGLSLDDYDEAEARALAEKAEAQAAAGDAVGAYETYRAAYAKRPLPDIKSAMRGVKARAAAVLKKLEAARALAERRRFEGALRIYDQLITGGKAPESVQEEAAAVREDLVRDRADDARRYAERGDLVRARRALVGVLPHVDLGDQGKDELRASMALSKDGDPAAAVEALGRAGLPDTSPVVAATRALAVGEARRQVSNARRLSRRDKAKALIALAKLSAFEEDLPEITSLRRSLRSDALEDLLEDAVRAARKGDDVEAAAALQAAVQAGDAPDALRKYVDEGLGALKEGRYAESEQSFKSGLAEVPRSRIAQEGARVAQIRRGDAEREALKMLRSKSPRSAQAVDVLAASFELSPANGAAREGRAMLEDRLRRAEGLSDVEVASTLGWLARLTEMDAATRAKVEEGADLVEAGRFEGAEALFAAVSTHPIAQTGQAIARARVVGSLKASAAQAEAGTEAGAEAIAALFERDPKDPEAKKGLENLLVSAESAAARRDDREAARFLRLATRATRPSDDLQAALEKGHSALAAGDLGAAVDAYGAARGLAPADPVALRAEALTKKIDAQVLAQAVSTGEVSAASAALRRTIERDPQSAAARDAIENVLAQADAAVIEGRYGQAAELYEVANVATPDAGVRGAVSKATVLLAQQNLSEAVKAYDGALANGRSVAGERARAAATKAKTNQLVASAKVLTSMEGADLDRAALDVRTLLRGDPTQADGRAAVTAVLDHAQAAAVRGDADTVARDLGLAAQALGQTMVTRRAIDMIRRGQLEEAQKSFTKNAGDLAERGPKIVSGLRLQTLRTGLGEGGVAAAENIRDLLRADPNDPTARQAYEAIVARVRTSASAGQSEQVAAGLLEAMIASGGNKRLVAAVKEGARPLEIKRYADAEAAFLKARAELSRSEVVDVAVEASRTLRTQAEAAALAGLAAGEDPRVHAEVLLQSRTADPNAPALAKGVTAALARARASVVANDAGLLSRSLAAGGRLEAATDEGAVAITEAAELIAKGELAEAELAYEALRGRVATEARQLIRDLRILRAKKAVEAAAGAGKLLEEAQANQALLALAPNDRDALKRAKRLATEVKTSRVAAAEKQLELGKPGVAWMYLDRALRLAPGDADAERLKARVENNLKKRSDLILVVEAIRRDGVPRANCRKLDAELQAGLMAALSKRTDLGGYVLSEGWTNAWRKKDPRAPVVNGGLSLVMKSCTAGSGAGKMAYEWAVETPKGGKAVVEGGLRSEVKPGSLLVDERDGAGNNVRRLLVDRTVEGIVEAIKGDGPKVRQWLLTAAEHELENKEPEAAADAFARYQLNPAKSADPDRVEAIQKALDLAFP